MTQGKKEQPPLFAFLDYVLKKQKIDHIHLKGLYMVNRFLSMNSQQFAVIVNMTTNRWARNLKMNSEMELVGKFLYKILPKVGKNAVYIKKTEKDDEIIDIELNDIAKALELSQREIGEYTKTLNFYKNLP